MAEPLLKRGRSVILRAQPESLRNDSRMEPRSDFEGYYQPNLQDLLPEVPRGPDSYERIADFGKQMLMNYYSDPSSLGPMPMIVPTRANLTKTFLPGMREVQ